MRIPHPALLLAAALAAAPAAAQNGAVTVDASSLQSLQTRLTGFAGALPAEERVLWDRLLLRASSAPAPATEVRVAPVLHIGPGGGCDGGAGPDDAANRVAIIVEGGRTGSPANGIVVQGGRTPAARGGIVVQGGRTPSGTPAADAPRPTPAGGVAIRTRPGNAGAVAIGPKQDDPAPPPQSLGRRIAELSAQLPEGERGALEWLLTRAATAPEGQPGTPGGLPPGTSVSLRQALGIDPLAIGPKQDDPAPPPPAQRWILRN
jgi:hypothetical protein